MIPAGVEIFVGLEPIDLRWGFDRLAGLVEDRLGRVARGGGNLQRHASQRRMARSNTPPKKARRSVPCCGVN